MATKKAKRAKPRVAAGDPLPSVLLINLVTAVVAEYPQDKCAPGVVVSLLPDGQWYVSVCRYMGPERQKVVVCSAIDRTLLAALSMASAWWMARVGGKRRLAVSLGLDDEPSRDRWGRLK